MPTKLLTKAMMTMPDASLRKYLPPAAPDQSAQFIVNQGDRELTLFLDPASGALLGTMDNKWNLQAVARSLHADLLLGTTGDRLIELAAGWGIVLLISGLYLWWPRKGPVVGGILWPRVNQRGRLWWRDLHAVVGFWGRWFPAAVAVERHDLDRFLGRSVCRGLEPLPRRHVERGAQIGATGPHPQSGSRADRPLGGGEYPHAQLAADR